MGFIYIYEKFKMPILMTDVLGDPMRLIICSNPQVLANLQSMCLLVASRPSCASCFSSCQVGRWSVEAVTGGAVVR